MEHLFRLAMMAGTGAGLTGLRRVGIRIVWTLAGAMTAGVLLAVALGYWGYAIYMALIPSTGPIGAAAAVGAIFFVVALAVWIVGRGWPRRTRVAPTALQAGLPALEIGALLSRNATTVLLTAFVAGMLLNRRR